ncbi:Deuterolysin metalloprotease family-domain-containing protein [Colletotrichum navitas]|uniref:Neutral protease 2 n=1 Tax=Colletotrichum navitas TaxID=681940 RepID=A0AAD8PM10_9PEZI|nr:Deuterolysin metalloprotease family-domain-containing protein [Colletotrichum navitas]KAK1569697.1 Deuterolysin metalloprotease family-domain-containing protein [Colletotrichum navitas]
MKFLAGLSCLAALASAAVVDLNKRDSPINVKIEAVGNTGLKASITNTGASDLKVLRTGSILGKLAVEKAEVFTGSEQVAFDGVRLRLATSGIAEDAFEIIPAGKTVDVEWDIAEVHNLSAGGKFDVAAKGSFSFANADSDEIVGTASFNSNILSLEVDGAAAAKVRREFHENIKRTVVQSDCTGTQRTATTTALSNCRALAAAASSAAVSGPAAKMTEYFKSSSSSTRSTVAAVFARVASECGSTTSGVSRQYCTDIYPACSSGVIAYTLPSQSYMVNCPYFFNSLTALSRTCHAQDRATTALHEVTHLTQIKGTTDQSSCYGYSCVQSLSAAQNLNHADTYALFANAIYVGC